MLSQTTAITGLNLKSIPERWGPSLVIVVGLAGVVAVFTALFAMAEGFSSTLKATGSPNVALVLRGGSQAELNSGLSRDEVTLIKQSPGIKRDAEDRPIASAELMVITELLKPGEKTGMNVTMRGVEPLGIAMRPSLKLVEGRMFETGLREMIVGKGVAQNFVGAKVGGSVRMRGSDWAVVGVFDSGDAHNSELIADAETAQSAFGRRGYTSLIAQLDGADGLTKLKDAVSADPRLNADIQLEQEYYTGQTRQFRQTIGFIGFIVTFIMGMGAIFAALNTMYAAVATRSREIATLRALGFRGLPVVASVMIESLVLALIGGALGAGIAYVLFNNSTVSTLGQNFTQVVFTFQVTPALVVRGLVISVLIGMVGGLLPAIRAARLPVTTALRQA